jgi:short-subunit dehydrogenase
MKFNNKIVWITGASSGIGKALAYKFINEGAIVVASSSSKQKLEEAKQNAPNPDNFYVFPLDLGNPETIKPLVEQVIAQFGKVDILINNAGVSQRSKILETPIENDRKIMEIDYFGTIILTKALLPYMIKQGGGHILCTSSIVGVFGFPLRSAYSAAKHALHGFFESLRIEYYEHNINVGIIIGGRIQTPISMSAVTSDGTPYGKMDDGQKNGITAEKAAKQILDGIRKNKKEIWIGGSELLMIALKRWFPALHFKISKNVKPT